MRAGVFRGVRDVRVIDQPVPEIGPADVLLKVAACGVCGSDLRAYCEGTSVAPGQVMGHEFAGEVVAVGAAVDGIALGDRLIAPPLVACGTCARCREGDVQLCETSGIASIGYGLPGAFAEFVRVPGAVLGRTAFPLAAGVSYAEGAMVEPFAAALRA